MAFTTRSCHDEPDPVQKKTLQGRENQLLYNIYLVSANELFHAPARAVAAPAYQTGMFSGHVAKSDAVVMPVLPELLWVYDCH